MKEKSYNLFGSTWRIQFVDEVVDEKDEIELTVLHGIVHSIFQTGQYMSCDNDEPLVEWTARCLKALKEQHII